jgi:hypothetical protein
MNLGIPAVAMSSPVAVRMNEVVPHYKYEVVIKPATG